MFEVSSREELIRALNANDIVVIGYYDPDSPSGRFFIEMFNKLEKYVDPVILMLGINTRRNPELATDISSNPCIRVYYKGRVVFEQLDFFGKTDLDIYVLRRSIRTVLFNLNVKVKI